MPTLRVLAGPSPSELEPITSLVNTNTPHRISTECGVFDIIVFIKGFNQTDSDESSTQQEAEYFGREDRNGVTWSIQVQGRFLSPRSADDILFGNIFERPLKLPWGTGAALKFMKFIDPTLSHDLTCQATHKPWALSPLLATMPHLKHTRLDHADADCPPFPTPASIADDTSSLHLCAASISANSDVPRAGTPSSLSSGSSRSSLASRMSGSSRRSRSHSADSKRSRKRSARDSDHVPREMTSQQRRSYFSSETHRQAVVLGPQDVVTTDFCYGFLEFSPSLRLRLPGGLGFDLARYWDRQPVRFVCCERRREQASDHYPGVHGEGAHPPPDTDPWGPVFWCVSIEMDPEAEEVDGE